MRALKYFIPFGALAYTAFDIIRSFASYVLNSSEIILTTPYKLVVLPVTLFVPKGIVYFSQANAIQNQVFANKTWIFAISPHLATIAIYQIIAMFIYFYARVTRLERAFIIFTFFLSFYFLFFLDYVAANQYHSFFLFLALTVNIPFIYVFRSFYNRSMHWSAVLILTTLLTLIAYVFLPTNATEEALMVQVIGFVHLASLLYCFGLYFWHMMRPGKKDKAPVERPVIREILTLAAVVSLALPTLSFLLAPYLQIEVGISKNALYFLPAIFPMVLFFLSLKFGLVRFDIPIYGYMIRVIYFIFFSGVYWFSMGFHISQFHYYDNSLIWHLIAAVAFLLILDPLRTIFFIYVNQYLINRRQVYRRYLTQAATSISNPRQIGSFLEKFASSARDGLGVKEVKVIFAESEFKDWRVQSEQVKYLADDHPIWTQIRFRKLALPFPAFTHGVIGPAKDLLLKLDAFLLVAFQNFRVAITISEKKNLEPFFSEDVNYVRSLLRLSEPLLENYKFLIANIHLRRQEKELELASRIQKMIIPTHYESKGLEFVSYSRASQKVTGDYIDLIETGKTKTIFLGDVSGHGLGSSYIMAVLRSMIRGALSHQGSSLDSVFSLVNDYLSEEYKGSDFMTLFGVNIATQGKKAVVEYINAGQHPAVIYLKKSARIEKLEKSQRVLGVISTNYEPDVYETNESFRLYLYSDGAFEIFDDGGKMLGEQILLKWIKDTVNLSPQEQLNFLKDQIYKKVTNLEDMDDLSLLIVDVTP